MKIKTALLHIFMIAFLAGTACADRILQLDDGMPIVITPTEDISSADNETGQAVTFSLLQDCKVDGIVLIPKVSHEGKP